MNLQARELRYFLALSETLSFTEAAKRCEISQPALTRAIKGLEDKLGGRPLVHREKGFTHLSALGLAMKPHFESVLNELLNAKEEARVYQEQQRQALRLGVLNTLEPAIFGQFLEAQAATADRRTIELHEATAASLSEMLRRGDIDLAITSRADLNQESPKVLPLFSERLMIALPTRHPLATGQPTSLEAAADEPFIPRSNCEYADEVLKLIAEMGIEVAPTATPVRDEWVLSMVRCGAGFTLLPEHARRPDGIALSPLARPQLIRHVSLVVSHVRDDASNVQGFVTVAKSFNWDAAVRSGPSY